MAKIVEVTNPVTGQPTQVDQLDHTAQQIDDAIARALPGGYYDKWVSQLVNPNLLDNWYFGNPVNQRGQTSYSVNGYTIDRWYTAHNISYGTLTVDKTAGCVTISHVDDGGFVDFIQTLENPAMGIVTLSVLMLSGNLYSATGTLGNISLDADEIFIRSGNPSDVVLRCKPGKTISMIAVKLELGSQQTLAHQDENGNWVLNEVPDYGEQLRRCQMYYLGDMQRDAPGRISGEHTAYCIVPIPVTMRQSSATPIQVFSDFGVIVDKDGTIRVVNNASCVVEADSYLLFSVSSADTMPPGPCIWQDAHFSISKDL